MPCVTIHCLVHLITPEYRAERFPAIHVIKNSLPEDPEHFSLGEMVFWATVPYAIWQLSYHFLISVRRRAQIAAGRPTSFTWLRRSYAGTWIGKFVVSLPAALQEPAFMGIQYIYALLTMVPCPLWFNYRWASAGFLMVVFTWSVYNGAVYYIDIFGKRFEKELNKLKEEIARWQLSPEMGARTPRMSTEDVGDLHKGGDLQFLSLGQAAMLDERGHKVKSSVDSIPMLDPELNGKVGSGTNGKTEESNGTLEEQHDVHDTADTIGGSTGFARTLDGGIVRERAAIS